MRATACGGRIVWVGAAERMVVGEDALDWDQVGLVEDPSVPSSR